MVSVSGDGGGGGGGGGGGAVALTFSPNILCSENSAMIKTISYETNEQPGSDSSSQNIQHELVCFIYHGL